MDGAQMESPFRGGGGCPCGGVVGFTERVRRTLPMRRISVSGRILAMEHGSFIHRLCFDAE